MRQVENRCSCRRLSRHCPVLLLTQQETSIETRLAAARAASMRFSRGVDISELDWLNDLIGRPRSAALVLIIDDDELVAETYVLALNGPACSSTRRIRPRRSAE